MECNLHFHSFSCLCCTREREKFTEQFKVFLASAHNKHSLLFFSRSARNSSSSAAGFVPRQWLDVSSHYYRVDFSGEQRIEEGKDGEGSIARAATTECWDNVVNNFQVEIISFHWAANGATKVLVNCTSSLSCPGHFFLIVESEAVVFQRSFQFSLTWLLCVEQRNLSA